MSSIFVCLFRNPFSDGQSTARKRGTSCRINSRGTGERCPVFCMSSNTLAGKLSTAQAAIGDQSFLGWRISLVKHMISKGKKDRVTINAFGKLHYMWMVAHNEIRPS